MESKGVKGVAIRSIEQRHWLQQRTEEEES